MNKEDLIEKANQLCNDSPKNSSQMLTAFMIKNGMHEIVRQCNLLAESFNLPKAAGLFMYLNNMVEPPKCIDCHTDIPRFISLNVGFNERCRKCGTIHSHQHLSIVNKNKSQSTIEKLRESNKRTAEKKKQDQLT